jgi:hypothetical protein
MSDQNNNSPLPPPPSPSFDQIVKGDVCITKIKNKKNMYRITFSKIGKFLVYQVWDKDNIGNINAKRRILNVPAKDWINTFIQLNKDLKEKGKVLFTPTTIMETTNDDQYAFVIRKIHFDSHDRVVFTISTKEIQLSNNCSKKLIQIPCGKFNKMRFDIDFLDDDDKNSDNALDAIPQWPYRDVNCWSINQLSSLQQMDWNRVLYYSSRDGNPPGTAPGPGMRQFKEGEKWYAYTCRSYELDW